MRNAVNRAHRVAQGAQDEIAGHEQEKIDERGERNLDLVMLHTGDSPQHPRSSATSQIGHRNSPGAMVLATPCSAWCCHSMAMVTSSQPSDATYSAMRARCLASGSRPRPAARLAIMCSALSVPGMTAVTAVWERMNFRKNWPQLVQSKSAAQSGSLLPKALRNSLPRPKGTATSTAAPTSAAAGSSRSSASRL